MSMTGGDPRRPGPDGEEDGPANVRLASLGRLAGGIAHDFNNILGVILNYGEFVRESLTDAAGAGRIDDAMYRDVVVDLDRILTAAHRAAGLTQQLLAFTGRRVAGWADVCAVACCGAALFVGPSVTIWMAGCAAASRQWDVCQHGVPRPGSAVRVMS